MKRLLATTALMIAATQQASAEAHAGADSFVSDNLIAALYHEFGHGVINLWELPIYGREEDAADNLSVIMIHRFYESEVSENVIRAVAQSYQTSADEAGEDFPYWDVHGSDEQRFYNTLCIYYGLDPEARQEFAEEMGLPEDRAEGCVGEAALVERAWGSILDEMVGDGTGTSFSLVVNDDSAPFTSEVMQGEVDALNAMLSMDFELPIVVEACGEPNAFYSEETQSITMCVEFEAEYRSQQ